MRNISLLSEMSVRVGVDLGDGMTYVSLCYSCSTSEYTLNEFSNVAT